jgi:hypothetical protein
LARRLDLGNRISPNIFKVSYRSAINGRVARIWVKVPYGGLFALNETLARQLASGNLLWFRVDIAKPDQIAEHRSELARFMGALMKTTRITAVDWTA